MIRKVKIDKTLTAEEILSTLQSQFPDYQIKTNRNGSKMFVKTGRSGGLEVHKTRSNFLVSKWRFDRRDGGKSSVFC